MNDVLQVAAVIALIVWGIGTFITAIIGLLQIIVPFDRDDAKDGLLMFFLPFLWPLALARMIVVTIKEVRDDAKAEARVRAVEEERRQARAIREAEERAAWQKAAEQRAWEENFRAAEREANNRPTA